MKQVEDPVFSTNTMGEGIAIIPEDEVIASPVDGVITCLFKTKHAIEITTKQGVEVLLHVGIDTVRLDGTYFDCFVKQGDFVRQREPLIQFDLEKIRKEGFISDVMMIVTNTEKYKEVKVIKEDRIQQGEPLIIVK